MTRTSVLRLLCPKASKPPRAKLVKERKPKKARISSVSWFLETVVAVEPVPTCNNDIALVPTDVYKK